MKILVTGGSGFIGTNLMEYYLSKGVEAINLSTDPPKNPEHKSYWRKVNILDAEGLRTEIASFSPSHIISLAAQTGTIDKGRTLEYYAANFHGLRNLVEIAKDTPSLKRLISTSSMLVCKNDYQPQNETDYCPDTLYGQSKVLGEKVVREAGDLPYSWVIVRPTGIWGPWFEAPYTTLFRLIQRGLYVQPANNRPVQSLGFVGNTVYQFDTLMQAPQQKVHGKTFYLADYPATNMWEWTALVQKAFKARRIREVPIWALKAVAKAGDAMQFVGWSNPPLFTSRLHNLMRSYVFDLDPLITEDLPYTLEQAVEITVDWISKNQTQQLGKQ
jgi:nucleoside-diphosphate-sugar epimerase